jgi:hypothetical protein
VCSEAWQPEGTPCQDGFGARTVNDSCHRGQCRGLPAPPEWLARPPANLTLRHGASLVLQARVARALNATVTWRREGVTAPGQATGLLYQESFVVRGGLYELEVHTPQGSLSARVAVAVRAPAEGDAPRAGHVYLTAGAVLEPLSRDGFGEALAACFRASLEGNLSAVLGVEPAALGGPLTLLGLAETQGNAPGEQRLTVAFRLMPRAGLEGALAEVLRARIAGGALVAALRDCGRVRREARRSLAALQGSATESTVTEHVDPCAGVACEPAGGCLEAGACVAGACVAPAVAAGTPCDDGDAATTGDVCTAGGLCAGTYPAVDCVLSAWSAYGACEARVGGGYERYRARTVLVAPAFGGLPCAALSEAAYCEPVPCAVGEWGAFSACAESFPYEKRRTRNVTTAAQFGGLACPLLVETSVCEAVNCLLSDWVNVSACSATCGGGTLEQTRAVIRPASAGGVPCEGPLSQERLCADVACRRWPLAWLGGVLVWRAVCSPAPLFWCPALLPISARLCPGQL